MWRLGSGRLCIEGTLIRKTVTNRCLLAFEGGGDLLRVFERFLVILRSLHPQTRFELTIQKLIGVQFRRICGKEKEFDFFRMSFAPGSCQLCVVNSAVVADDEELSALSAVVLDQTMQEAYEGITAHGASLECESRQSLIVHGRDHDGGAVAGTAVMQDRRRLSARCVAANPIGVLLDRSFIFPKKTYEGCAFLLETRHPL